MDPNQIIAQPEEWVWLAPDWSDYASGDKPPAGKTGWTRVKIRVTRYADGRIVRNVLDANGAPLAADGTAATQDNPARVLDTDPRFMIDKEQETRFRQGQTQAGRGDQEGDTRGPQNGPTREVYRSGKWVVEPNPLYQPDKPTSPNATNPSSRFEVRNDGPGGAPRLIKVEERRNAQGGVDTTYEEVPQSQWPVTGTSEVVRNGRRIKVTNYGHGLPPREDDVGEDTSNRGTTVLKPDGKGGTVAVTTYPDGRPPKTEPVPGVPSDKPQPQTVTIGGRLFERDPQTGTYSPAKGAPSEGEATVASSTTPSMPRFTASTAMQSLAEYHDALAKDPSKTPAQREKLFEEARQVANLVVQQAATEQRERESRRNLQYNRANTLLTHQQNSMTGALEFASKINGTLPPGSNLGGKAFVAILGMNMMAAMGYGLAMSAMDFTDEKQVEAKSGQVWSAATRATTPPSQAAAAQTEADRQRNTAAGAAAGAAPAPAAAAAPAPVPAPVAAPPISGQARDTDYRGGQPADGNERPDDIITLAGPDGRVIWQRRSDWDAHPSSWHNTYRVVNAEPASAYIENPDGLLVRRSDGTSPGNGMRREAGTGIAPPVPAPGTPPAPYGKPAADPSFTSTPAPNPGGSVLPDPQLPVPIPYPTSTGLQSSTAPQPTGQGDYAVLNQPMTSPTSPLQASVSAAPSGGDYAVLSQPMQQPDLYQQAAAKPVWQMSEDEYNQYRAAGIPDSVIMSLPGAA